MPHRSAARSSRSGLALSGQPPNPLGVRRFGRPSMGSSSNRAWVVVQRLGLVILLGARCSCRAASDSDRTASNLPATGAQPSRPIAFRVPPHARFVAPDAAVVSWETQEPCESIIEYGVGEKWDRQVREPGSATVHRVTLPGLEPKARYQYRIRAAASDKGSVVSEAFELDNALNFAVARVPDATSPYGSDAASRKCAQTAEQILSASGVTRGYCLVLNCNDGQLAYELAKRSELIVFGVDNDHEPHRQSPRPAWQGRRLWLADHAAPGGFARQSALSKVICELDRRRCVACRREACPGPPPRSCRYSNPQPAWRISVRYAPRPRPKSQIKSRNGSAR